MSNLISRYHNFYSSNKVYINVFIFFWSLFALTNNGWDSSEGSYGSYLLAERIIKHGDLGSDTPLSYLFMAAPNGKYYLVHEVGNTIFMLPTAFINFLIENIFSSFVKQETIDLIQRFILSFQSSTYSAITATTFFSILRIGFSQPIIPSLLATLCMATTSYFWTYSRSLFDGILCTTLLTLSFFFMLIYRQKNNWWYLVSCFICLGFGLITRLSIIVPIIASFAYLVSICRSSLRVREVSIALLTLLPFVVWQSWYNQLRTGLFYKSSVQICCPENNALDGNLLVGIGGLLLSPGKSLFIYAPLIILSFILFKKFFIKHRKEAIYIVILTILWFLLHAKLRSWYGATGWGPRHFITILPILFLPFAVNLEYALRRTVLKIPAIFLAGFGLILSIASIITGWHFRMEYGTWRGLISDEVFVWSFWNSQPIDLLKGACGNILRILNHAPAIKFPSGASETYYYANSTINIWPNSLIYVGIPWYVVMFLVTPLLFLIYFSTRTIFRGLSDSLQV